jgi:Arc/MetJ family transcription regulator
MCKEGRMATNVSLDSDLIERALRVSGERTKKAAVTRALEEFIGRRKQKRIRDLMGKLEWDRSLGYKVDRSRS